MRAVWLVLAAWLALAACGRLGFDHGEAVDARLTPTCIGHDEDGDVFPDDCDVCPTVADSDQRDGDRDGVGDACDPRPLLGGDFILRFEPHTDRATASYLFETRVVTWLPDTVRLGALDDAGSLTYQLDAYPSRVAAGVRVVDASALLQWFGIWYNLHPTAADPKIFVSAAYTPPAPTVLFSLKEQVMNGQERFCPEALGPPRFMPEDRYAMMVDTTLVTGGDHVVRVSSATDVYSCALSIAIPPFNRGFLETNNMIVEFDYFIAYGIR